MYSEIMYSEMMYSEMMYSERMYSERMDSEMMYSDASEDIFSLFLVCKYIYTRMHMYIYICLFPLKRLDPQNPPIEKLKFLGISRYKFKLRFCFDLTFVARIPFPQFGGFRGCSGFGGICHNYVQM